MRWLKKFKCRCAPSEPAPAPIAPVPEVPLSSPARVLHRSLTGLGTRDEWTAEYKTGLPSSLGSYGHTEYRNRARDITLRRYEPGENISTPFKLSIAEQRIVCSAVRQLEEYLRQKREQSALARLLAQGTSGSAQDAQRLEPKGAGPVAESDAP